MLSKRIGLLQYTVYNEGSTLARLAFCENLSVDLAKNKYRLSVLSGLNLEKM